ncbi:sensor histidine kinase [Halocella sp. SP3-1]|nr:sensor histidine kinase [Halocella sp. SP3-1]
MMTQLLFDLIKSMAVVAVAARLLVMETSLFSRLTSRRLQKKYKLLLIVFFGLLSLSGTYLGIYIHGAYANIRAIGAVIGGLLGGPLVGFSAGLIGGLHRYFLGGFTAVACALSTTLAGLIGGLVYYYRSYDKISLLESFVLGVLIESLEMLLVAYLSQPFYEAVELVKIIALPMITSNALGIMLFINVLHNNQKKRQELLALQSYKALKIANQTISYLRDGLNYDSALETARIILKITEVNAVSITDREKILAHCGMGEDHHQAGEAMITRATKEVLKTARLTVAASKEEVGCPVKNCTLKSAVIAPLKHNNDVIGVIKLYKDQEDSITEVDIELARGISRLLSTQLQISNLEKQAQLTTEMELKALQAQINPHFLFNALNTISSFCRTNPQAARGLLIKLAKFFRQTLKENKGSVTLQEELRSTSYYIEIEKARFGSKLEIEIEIADELLNCQMPPFVLQPVVENAIKHGFANKTDIGKITMTAERAEHNLLIYVQDNGAGIPAEYIKNILQPGYGQDCGIGISNANQRIQKICGTEYGIDIDSQVGQGTIVKIKLPLKVN